MPLTGSYIYRVDLVHRNAQNEEVRSHSFYTNQIVPVAENVTLTVRTCITRRVNSYFLIYRNVDGGTNWYLVNSRDPNNAEFVLNDQQVATVEWVDDGTIGDAVLEALESHPGNGGFSYVERYSAPSCEVIAAGADRLWVSGGEVPVGQAYPSRLFDPGETPAFNGFLAVQVDRSAEPITAIGAIGDLVMVCRRNSIYLIDGEGPDNSSNGNWPTPRLAYSDLGVIGQESLAVIALGLLFQSTAGIRLITANGSLISTNGEVQNIGGPVDTLAQAMDIAGVVVVPQDQEARFYGRNGQTLVLNYEQMAWSTWDVTCAGAVRNTETGLGILATHDGYIWEESDGLYLDNGAPYLHRVRFAWLRANGLMDFQAVRTVGGLGEASEAHDVRVQLYYDERDYPGEEFTWSYPFDGASEALSTWNNDTFGANTFGSGTFGDTHSGQSQLDFRDSVWRWTRSPSRRKCSVFSVSVDDNWSEGRGFVLTALALEVGQKQGLDKVPAHGGSFNNPRGSGSSRTGRE